MGWENADRFAGSPNNSSTGETTLVNPSVATVDACADPDLIGTSPYFDDCRWKVQHLRVRGNLFKIRPDRIPNCTGDSNCGFNGLFANYGSDPDWSPYKAWVVTDGITFEQDNLWSRNRYVGPWRFQIYQLGDEGLLEHLAFVEVRSGRGQHPQVRQGHGPGHPVHDRRVLEERDFEPTAGARIKPGT